MQNLKIFLSLTISANLLVGVIAPVKAQTNNQTKIQDVQFTANDRREIYAKFFKNSRGKIFSSVLKKTIGVQDEEAVGSWLDENGASLINAVETAARDEIKQVLDERIDERKRKLEQDDEAEIRPATTPTPKKPFVKKAAFNPNDNLIWQSASLDRERSTKSRIFNGFRQDEPQVTVTRTADGTESSGAIEKIMQ